MADAAATTGPGAARYAAFISYSHADSEMCDRLHKRLESYVIPHSLVGCAGPNGRIGKHLGKCFRDRVDLGAHHDLGAEIREALDHSAALIVLCSPQSAGSKYVEEEIRYFKSLGRVNQVFAAIIAGEPHAAGKPGLSAADECFPRALVYRVGDDGTLSGEPETSEPIAADLRDKKDGVENGALKLVAGLLDIGLDDLVQREKQAEARRRRQAYLVSGVMGALAIGAAIGGIMAWQRGETIRTQSDKLQAQATQLEEEAVVLKAKDKTIQEQNTDLTRKLAENQSLTTRITSVVGEISRIVENDPNVSEELLFLSLGARLGISAKALKAILDGHIGNIQELKVSNYGGQHVCMGVQYCDQSFTVVDLRKDWEGVLPQQQIERIAKVWGVKPVPEGLELESATPDFQAIKRVAASVSDIRISRRDGIRVFGRAQLSHYCDQVRTIWPDADLLPPDAFGALVYTVVQYGSRDATKMAEAVRAGKYPDVPAGIRALGKKAAAWVPSEKIGERILARSEEQAQLYADGMKGAAPVAVGSKADPS